jgi:hypothetical protein
VKVAQKLLGAPTIGGGSAWAGGGGGGSKRRQISPQSAEIYRNSAENRQFSTLFGLKIAKNAIFRSKVFNKMSCEEYIKICSYLRHFGVIPVQSFGSHIHAPPAIWIRVNIHVHVVHVRIHFRIAWA